MTNTNINTLYWSKLYNSFDLIGYELIIDNKVVLTNKSQFGKMVAGGLLFGGIGAVAGSLVSEKSIEVSNKSNLFVRLLLNDLEQASIDLMCRNKSLAYQLLNTLKLAEEKYVQESRKA